MYMHCYIVCLLFTSRVRAAVSEHVENEHRRYRLSPFVAIPTELIHSGFSVDTDARMDKVAAGRRRYFPPAPTYAGYKSQPWLPSSPPTKPGSSTRRGGSRMLGRCRPLLCSALPLSHPFVLLAALLFFFFFSAAACRHSCLPRQS